MMRENQLLINSIDFSDKSKERLYNRKYIKEFGLNVTNSKIQNNLKSKLFELDLEMSKAKTNEIIKTDNNKELANNIYNVTLADRITSNNEYMMRNSKKIGQTVKENINFYERNQFKTIGHSNNLNLVKHFKSKSVSNGKISSIFYSHSKTKSKDFQNENNNVKYNEM